MSDQSYDNIPRVASDSSDDLDSLPSTSASTTSISPSEEEWQSDAEREWKESLQQLELLLTMVLVPYLGKYFGRKAAYWAFEERHDTHQNKTLKSSRSRASAARKIGLLGTGNTSHDPKRNTIGEAAVPAVDIRSDA
ncbi:unnamed protein product [Aureobasidium vineae]|uniref:Uncharacterized protein n=1 Tax=Aureobasidium vineae TaxID=2773715 RepID=A0A9N8JSS0_9PEZI|nr:unnamed protein product [Aureobasidium vineae]